MASPKRNPVFLNVPFDPAYESLFVTLVGMLVCLGYDPHCVLEVREQGDGRLVRIFELMRSCRMSIHDVSRTGSRFNMPFELRMACALKLSHPEDYELFVLDEYPFRIDRKLSDYKGRDPLIHNGTSNGMMTCLLDVFASARPAADFRNAARALRGSVRLIKRQFNATSLFRPSLFRLVLAAATDVARDRGFIPGDTV